MIFMKMFHAMNSEFELCIGKTEGGGVGSLV